MKFIPIRTKILVTLLALTIGVLTAFLLTARSIFLQDKMAYLFDSNQRSAEERALVVNSQLQQWLLSTRSLSLYVDAEKQSLGEAGEILYEQFKDLDGVLVSEWGTEGLKTLIAKSRDPASRIDEDLRQELTSALRQQGRLPILRIDSEDRQVRLHQQLQAANLDGRTFYLSFALNTAKLAPLFLGEGQTSHVLLGKDLNPVFTMDQASAVLWTEISKKGKFAGLSDISQTVETTQGNFLVSFSRLSDYDYFVVAMTPESVVNRVLQDLSVRTMYVFGLSFFSVLGLSVIFAKSLTVNLEQLSEAVQKISKGDFNISLQVRSRDETGQLAEGFKTMSREIQRLLTETADKARMEGELRTAQAVQSTLFPEGGASLEGFDIVGSYRSASECGGDWWYYKTRGQYLYAVIADATGHGAPAALITSAARSAFSLIAPADRPEETPGIESVARSLNRAIFETSKGGLLMTALMLRVDLKNGDIETVNASHELPFLHRTGSGEKPECLIMDPSPRLGQSPDYEPKVHRFNLEEGMTLVLFTDGVADILSPEGKSYGERRFLKAISGADGTPGEMASALETQFESYRKGTELIDDVTLVLIGRSGLREQKSAA